MGEVRYLEYLLIECREREISTPATFGSREEAHEEMCKRVASVLDVPVEGLDGIVFDSNTCVCEYSAWTEHHGQNLDWKIFLRNDAGEYI